MKKAFLALALLLAWPAAAGLPTTAAPEPQSLVVTNDPRIQAVLESLLDSPTYLDLLAEASQSPEACPSIPVYTSRTPLDQAAMIVLRHGGRTGEIYLDLARIHRSGGSLARAVAAQVKLFHTIFVLNAFDPPAAYRDVFGPGGNARMGRLALAEAKTFAEQVAAEAGFDEGFDPRTGFDGRPPRERANFRH